MEIDVEDFIEITSEEEENSDDGGVPSGSMQGMSQKGLIADSKSDLARALTSKKSLVLSKGKTPDILRHTYKKMS